MVRFRGETMKNTEESGANKGVDDDSESINK